MVRRLLGLGRTGQGGWVIVLFSLLLIVLLGLAALVVDLGNAYLRAENEQHAADAAALAGAVYLPGDTTSAISAATSALAQDGMSPADTTFIGPDPADATFMRVTVRRNFPTVFAKVLGISSLTVSRTGIAAWKQSIPMGSPANVLGAQPGPGPSWSWIPGFNQNLYLAQVGAGLPKEYADRWDTPTCDTGEDYCSGSTNNEFKPGGRAYDIDVAPLATGYFEIQMYDPEVCTSGACPLGPESSGSPSDTTVTVNGPGGAALAACKHVYPPSSALGWQTICGFDIDNTTYLDGTYVLHIDMGENLADTSQNNYSIRAAFLMGGAGGAPNLVASKAIDVFGPGQMVTNHAVDVSADYYVAKVPSGFAGQTLPLQIYDFGELGGKTITVHWADPTYTPNEPVGCTWLMPVSGTTLTPDDGNCAFDYSAIGYGMNGRVVDINVPIPTTYSCTNATSLSCWLVLTGVYSGGGTVEGSSMSAGAPGSPVRLYNSVE